MAPIVLEKKDNLFEKAFYISVFLLMSMYTLRFSHISDYSWSRFLFYGMRFVSYGLVGLKFLHDLIHKKYSIKELICYFIIFIYFAIISYNSRTINYLIYYVYVIVGKDVKYTKIIGIAFYAIGISVAIVLLLNHSGFIKEAVAIQGDRIRHSLGFEYASYLSTYCFYGTLYYIYFRNKNIKNAELIVLFIINLCIFYKTTTKSAFFCSVLAILITLFVNKKIISIKDSKIYRYILNTFSILLPIFMLVASIIYNKNNKILDRVNNILSGRLLLSQNGLIEFRVKPFGQFIEFSADLKDGYNVVDSSYIFYLLILGGVFFVLMICFFVYFSDLIAKKKDIYLFYVFIILLMHATFDPQIFQMSHSAFFYILSYKNEVIKYE